jgi:hypothetical protein
VAKKLAADASPTTIFDFLWRLRTRSHYRDAKSIFLGVTSYEAANDYYRALLSVVSATLTAIETLIVCYRGPEAYASATAPLIAREVPKRSGNAAMASRFGLLAGSDAQKPVVDVSPAFHDPIESTWGARRYKEQVSRR